jgi:copper resistance protein D
MDWLGVADVPLVATRAMHFAATATVTGTLIFRAVVANPVLRSQEAAQKPFQTRTLQITWIGLAVTLASGVIWLLLQAVSMSGLPYREALTPDVLATILNDTQFGLVSEVRAALAIALAVCLAYDRFPLAGWAALAAALGLAAAIAWTGHAASTPGPKGNLHLVADAAHLLAAAAWIGGLVSLVVLLVAARRIPALPGAALAHDAASRFSALGILSVAILALSGIVNAWILVGSFHALLVTEYGQTLILKIVIFALMVAFAAINRFWLSPRLTASSGSEGQLEALRRLTRNSTIEIALGLAIFAIVGILGTQHPAIHGLH